MSDVRPITQNFARPSYRPQETAGLDPDMKRMILTAGGVGAGLAVIIALFSLSGHLRHHGIPVIAAPDKPVRIKPVNPGGMQVAGADDLASGGAEKLAPAAEKPAIRALHARKLERAPHEIVAAQDVPRTEPTVTAPAAPSARNAAPSKMAAEPAPKADAEKPGAKAAALTGATAVQLAAFESREAAERDWGRLAQKMPALFNGHTPQVVQAHLANRTVYRLRTGGFASNEAARSFCATVHAKGADCSIASF